MRRGGSFPSRPREERARGRSRAPREQLFRAVSEIRLETDTEAPSNRERRMSGFHVLGLPLPRAIPSDLGKRVAILRKRGSGSSRAAYPETGQACARAIACRARTPRRDRALRQENRWGRVSGSRTQCFQAGLLVGWYASRFADRGESTSTRREAPAPRRRVRAEEAARS